MNNKYLKIVSYMLYFVVFAFPIVMLLQAHWLYQYRDYGFMIVLQSPDKTLTPLIEPWLLFVLFAGLWIKAIFLFWLAGLKIEDDKK